MRRWFVGAALLCIPVCLFLASLGDTPVAAIGQNGLLAGVLVVGGLTLPMYSICIAHTVDHLRSAQIVAGSGTLGLVFGSGWVIGPMLGAYVVQEFEPSSLFYLLAALHLLSAMNGITGILRRPKPGDARPAIAVSVNNAPSAFRLNPNAVDDD